MLQTIKKHGLYTDEGGFKRLFELNFKFIRNVIIIAGILIIAAAFAATAGQMKRKSSAIDPVKLEEKSVSGNMVTVTASAAEYAPNKEIKFRIAMNTHVVELDYDLVKLSTLFDDQGKSYRPIAWEGKSGGGHHRSGILVFPKIMKKTKMLKLLIKSINDSDRVFIWKIEMK